MPMCPLFAFRCWLTRLKRQTKDRQSDRKRSEEKRQICEQKGQTGRQAGAQTDTDEEKGF